MGTDVVGLYVEDKIGSPCCSANAAVSNSSISPMLKNRPVCSSCQQRSRHTATGLQESRRVNPRRAAAFQRIPVRSTSLLGRLANRNNSSLDTSVSEQHRDVAPFFTERPPNNSLVISHDTSSSTGPLIVEIPGAVTSDASQGSGNAWGFDEAAERFEEETHGGRTPPPHPTGGCHLIFARGRHCENAFSCSPTSATL